MIDHSLRGVKQNDRLHEHRDKSGVDKRLLKVPTKVGGGDHHHHQQTAAINIIWACCLLLITKKVPSNPTVNHTKKRKRILSVKF